MAGNRTPSAWKIAARMASGYIWSAIIAVIFMLVMCAAQLHCQTLPAAPALTWSAVDSTLASPGLSPSPCGGDVRNQAEIVRCVEKSR